MIRDIKPLEFGDAVAIVAPCGLKDPAQADIAAHTASELHLVPVVYPSCQSKGAYSTVEDAARADDLNHAFFDSGTRAIWAIGCHSGAFRLMQKLRFRTAAMHPKLFCAPIEASALHLAYNQLSGLMTLQIPDLGQVPWSQMDFPTQTYLQDALFGTSPEEWENPPGFSLYTVAQGRCEGQLIGGDLADLCATLGTPYEFGAKDRILVLDSSDCREDVLDRMFVQLKHAGKFKDCAGVLLGTFGGDFAVIQKAARDLLLDEGKPVLYGASLRGAKTCSVLPLGSVARMDATLRTLTIVQQTAKKQV